MQAFTTLSSRVVTIPAENIDTDQIIPARYLKTTSKVGLGEHLFQDWRYDAEGRPRPDFPLNRPEAAGAAILLAGDNFGCGSSREHAAWALADFGFRAVISASIADIFRANAVKNGLVPVVVEPALHEVLLRGPADVVIDVEALTVTVEGGPRGAFPLDPFARHCLLHGVDELGFLLAQEPAIAAFEERP